MQSDTAQKITAKNAKRSFSKLNRPDFVSLRGRIAAVAIFKPKVRHPVAKHGAPARRISNISEIKMAGFITKPTIFVSLRGRIAAVAIFKPKVWHPGTKHGSRKRQNPEFLIRRGATPYRSFSGSAISRGRQPAFHMLQHLSHDQKSYFTAQPCRASFRDGKSFRQRLPRRAHAPSSQ